MRRSVKAWIVALLPGRGWASRAGVMLIATLAAAIPSAAPAQDFLKMSPEQALAKINRQLARTSAPKKKAELLGARSDVYWLKLHDLKRAFADATEAHKLSPDQGLYLRKRGFLLAENGDLDQAEQEYNKALQVPDVVIWDYLERADFLWDFRGNADAALKDLTAAIERYGSGNNTPRLQRANLYRDVGRYDLALADYSEILRSNPKDSSVFNNRAVLHRLRGDHASAMTDANRSIALNDKSHHNYLVRAGIFHHQGDLDRAIADLNTALKLYPRSALALAQRASLFRYRGDTKSALDDLHAALKVSPKSAISLTGLGLTYEKMGDAERAREAFLNALNEAPNRWDTTKEAQETARARLVALGSGAAIPAIPSSPGQAASPHSIPTAAAPVPATLAARPADKSRRVALVLGNSAYTRVSALTNPQKDADAIAASLRNIGFDVVTLAHDATREKMVDVLRAFAEEAEKADWALVYYAGHGIEVNGANYIIPVDAKLSSDRDVQFEAVPLDRVMAAVEGAKKLRLIVLDACRDNPFTAQMRRTAAPEASAPSTAGGAVGTRSVGRGLANVVANVAQQATLVVYAAKHGQVALDGEGANSPFAVAFVQRLATPGVEINKLFRLVRDDVMEMTAGRQEPFTYGSLPGREDFFFVAGR